MDSISQIVLGASLAHVTLGEKLGRRALLLGAALGTLPDLDVLVPYEDAIESFTYHRSWSHSLLVLSLISVPMAMLCKRLVKRADISLSRWWFSLWLILITHPLLDGFTVYGTQLLWPLPVPPTAWGSVFIIDPVYTLPLIVGVAVAWQRQWLQARPLVLTGLGLSTAYLAWTLVAQQITYRKVVATLELRDIEASHVLVAPFPFSLLWRVVVINGNEYLEGYSSLLDSQSTVPMQTYDNGKAGCADWLDSWPVARMDWFTRGAFALSVREGQLVLSDLRMGIEDEYVFEFALAEWSDDQWQPIIARQLPVDIDPERMTLLLQRVADERIDLTSPGSVQALGSCSALEQYTG